MILCAFMVGKVVETTGFGRRVSLILMKNMGGSLLGLGYSVFFSEFILGPFVPSNTARGGGILMPVVMSLINSLGSTPIYRAEIG
jgi:DASS family divalent anion:Na+ symporter